MADGLGWPTPRGGWFDEDMELPVAADGRFIPQTCECVVHLHEPPKPACTNPPQDNGTVRSSPALCTRCLFYCHNDEAEF